MNINGIKYLRQMGMPAPDKEILLRDFRNADLSWVYENCKLGATIISFDDRIPIDGLLMLETDEHKYGIAREDFLSEGSLLERKMLNKGVPLNNIVYMVHQSYLKGSIYASGRVAFLPDQKTGLGVVLLDLAEGLRKANTDFAGSDKMYSSSVSLRNGLPVECFENGYIVHRDDGILGAAQIANNVIANAVRMKESCEIDFEVYKEGVGFGRMFFHDMCMKNVPGYVFDIAGEIKLDDE